MLSELLQSAGPLCSADITPPHRSYGPLQLPLVFHRFPGDSGYTASCSANFSTGRGGSFQLLGMSLPSCCRPNPARMKTAASARLHRSMLPSPCQRGLGFWGLRFRGHFCVHFRYGPMTRSPSLKMALSIDSRGSVSLRSAIQATRLLTITSVGLFPTEHTSLHWTCAGTRCFSSSNQFTTTLILRGASAAALSLGITSFIMRKYLSSGLTSQGWPLL